MKGIFETLGGRKFLFAETLLVAMFILILVKVDLETVKTFFNYAVTIFGIFVVGNVTSKFTGDEEKQK